MNQEANDDNKIKFNTKFIINFTSESNQTITDDDKVNCKIIQFSSELSIDQKLAKISTLDKTEFPHLFIFVINYQNLSIHPKKNEIRTKMLQECLKKFDVLRPLIIQSTFAAENETKFYYKSENSYQFIDIDQKYPEDVKLYLKYKKELEDQELSHCEDILLRKLSSIKNDSLILQFLRTLTIEESVFSPMIFNAIQNGKVSDFLAVLDASFVDNRKLIMPLAQSYIMSVTEEDKEENEKLNEPDEDAMEVNESPNDLNVMEANELQPKEPPMEVDIDSKSKETNSILLIAILNKSTDIISYLIESCPELIQQLHFDHQVKVSTEAFETCQYEVLCDLIEYADFPFPEDFTESKAEVNERLNEITKQRMKLEIAINIDDENKINELIGSDRKHKFMYNTENSSALEQAIYLRKFKMYYYLKSRGLTIANCQEAFEALSKADKSEATTQAYKQRKTNINQSHEDFHKNVLHLSARSLIFNNNIGKQQEAKYRTKLRSWFEDIHKIVPEIIDITAFCEDLKIIFDFESTTTEASSLGDPYSEGTIYPVSRWIFVGSKITDKASEQKIKGIIAHELCHFVMRLVYENDDNPYYKHRQDVKEKFEKMSNLIDKWSKTRSIEPDDGCDGIISSVFKASHPDEFHKELIARVVQILVLFDNNCQKTENIQHQYNELFDFWFNCVLPELKTFDLKKREEEKSLNKTFKLINSIKQCKIELSASKDFKSILDNKIVIIKSNVPKLFMIDIYKYLLDKFGDLLILKNVFVDSKELKDPEMLKNFMKLMKRKSELSIFVDCRQGISVNLKDVNLHSDISLCFIVQDEKQANEVKSSFQKSTLNLTEAMINYKWSDLTEKSQELLLKSKINFQNSQVELYELIKRPSKSGPNEYSVNGNILNFVDLIGDELLNLVIEGNDVNVNAVENDSKEFNFLYQTRNFVSQNLSDSSCSEIDLLSKIENNKFVLISDEAGNGKSWTIKNIAKLISKKKPKKWVTYVDLKQFIKEFKAQMQLRQQMEQNTQESEMEFCHIFTSNILKSRKEFEMKIFKKMYKIGQVSIIFDGFDEIAPDCAEFVCDLAKSFQSNGGNQLWIATRNHFKTDLQRELQIEDAYHLNEFSQENGAELIARSWILDEADFRKINSKDEFENYIKISSKFKNYKEFAQKLVDKVNRSEKRSIEMPQIYQIIAKITKYNKEVTIDISETELYKKLIQKLYWIWSTEKGEIRKEANMEIQENNSNFFKCHRNLAIKSLLPKYEGILFPGYDTIVWKNWQITSCGLVTIIDGNIKFIHETFRDYFVADFITKNIMKPNAGDAVFDMFVEVMTIKKYEIVRVFLNSSLESSALEILVPKIRTHPKYEKMFEDMDSFGDICERGLHNLAKFIFFILKAELVEKLACFSDNKRCSKILQCISILNKFFKPSEFIEQMSDLNQNGDNVLHICAQMKDVEYLKVWEKIKHSLSTYSFKELLIKKSSLNQYNILHHMASNSNIKVHETLWPLILSIFEDKNELQNLICEKNLDGNNYLHLLISFGNIEVIKKVFECLKSTFSPNKFQEIVTRKNNLGQNLLQISVKTLKVFEFMWAIFQQSHHSKNSESKFLELLMEVDKNSNNLVHSVASFGRKSVFVFIAKELEKITYSYEIRNILNILGENDQNIIHLAATNNRSKELHEFLWSFLKKSFAYKEIKILVMHIDQSRENILMKAVKNNSKEIVELTWNKIKMVLKQNEQKTYLKSKCIYNETVQNMNTQDKNIHHYICSLFEKNELYSNSESSEDDNVNSDESMDEMEYSLSPLINSVKNNKLNEVERILKSDIDVNLQDESHKFAIDYALDNYFIDLKEKKDLKICEKIVLSLMKANSCYPKWDNYFNFDKSERTVQSVIELTDQLEEIIREYPYLRYFTERKITKVLVYCMRLQRMVLKNQISSPMQFDSEKCHPLHILKLLMKSKITCSNVNINGLHYVHKALSSIDKIQDLSYILKIASFINFEINFDFDEDIEQSHDSNSLTDDICIKAKNLLFPEHAHKVVGMISNKLARKVLNLLFMNGSLPYPKSTPDLKNKFDSIINEIKLWYHESRKIDGIFKDIFEQNHPNLHAEFAVTAIQLCAQHYSVPKKIHVLEKKYNRLYNFLKDVVYIECEKALAAFELINSKRISKDNKGAFNCLTDYMKEGIMEKQITFQGQEMPISKFEEIVENFHVYFDANDLYELLFKDNKLDIFKPPGNSQIQFLIVRNFIRTGANRNEDGTVETISNIVEQLEERKVFILSDQPKSGATYTFKQIATVFKIIFHEHLVIYVDIGECNNIIHEYGNDLDASQVPYFLAQICNIKNTKELGIFYQLYEVGKIIFLFDGFNKIPEMYLDIFTIVLSDFRDRNTNMILVSTQPHKSTFLVELFNINLHSFVPLSEDEINTINENIISKYNLRRNVDVGFFRFISDYNIENHFLLENFVKMYKINPELFTSESLNVYEIIESVVYEITKNSSQFLSEDEYKYLALKFIFKNKTEREFVDFLNNIPNLSDSNDIINELSIDYVQSDGLVFKDTSENSYNFIQKIIADFFVIKYFNSMLFEEINFPETECRTIFEVLRLIAVLSEEMRTIHIIFHFYKKFNPNVNVNNDIESILLDNLSQICDDISNSQNRIDTFKFWLAILPKDLKDALELNDDMEITVEIVNEKVGLLRS